MSEFDQKLEKYADDVRDTLGHEPDMDLLRRATEACGPSIYQGGAETIAATDREQLMHVVQSYIMARLGIDDPETAMGGLQAVIREYGRSDSHKNRAVIYYMLARHFDREDAV